MQKKWVIDASVRFPLGAMLSELWQRRALMFALSYRDVKARYTQTLIGMTWAIVNPVVSILLLVFVFNVVAGTGTEGVPALLYTVSGVCAWNYFSKVVSEAGSSIVGSQALIKKIYFPRLVIPLSKAISALIDFAIVLALLFILMIVYRMPLTSNVLWLIPCILLVFFVGIGSGIWVAALTIRFRDFHYIIPVALRIGMFASPIAFGVRHVPEGYKWIVNLNPVTGIIEGFRYALFLLPVDPTAIITSVSVSLFLFLTGILYFLHMEKYIADII